MTVRMRVPDAENQQRIREQAEAEGIRFVFVNRTAQRDALIMARHNLSCALGYWDELEKDNLRSYIEVAAEWLAKLEE